MIEFDFDGFFDNVDTLDDGFDHDELADGFHEWNPDETHDDDLGLIPIAVSTAA